MTDIFNEVDQDLRREQLKGLWNRFGIVVIGIAILIVIVTAGLRGWQYWTETRANAAGDRFVAALALSDAGKHAEADEAFAALAADEGGAYRAMAAIRAAAAEADAGNAAAAAERYEAVAADASTPALLRDVARLRAALLEVDTLPFAEVEAKMRPLADGGGPFRYSAREILGLAAWKAGDLAGARTWFQGLADEANTPNSLRQRAQEMLALIQGRIGAPPDAAAGPATDAPVAADTAADTAASPPTP